MWVSVLEEAATRREGNQTELAAAVTQTPEQGLERADISMHIQSDTGAAVAAGGLAMCWHCEQYDDFLCAAMDTHMVAS